MDKKDKTNLKRKENKEGTEVAAQDEKEISIDGLDGESEASQESPEIKKTEKGSPAKTLLQTLCEDELQELIDARTNLEEQSKILEEKNRLLAEYEDLLKRKQADFENYRKRVQREFEDYKKYATSDIVLDILNVIDDFERAIDSARVSKDFDTLMEGILLVEKQLRNFLENKYGIEPIETVGREFDPTVHDAIMMEESEQYSEDTVIEDFQKGYKLHDRVLRPAKVKVAKAVSSDNTANDNDNEDDVAESSGKGE
jgi:molecular chaperone GrpE